MRQKLITLDPVTWELAQKKPNFSEWVRNQLRSERNKQDFKPYETVEAERMQSIKGLVQMSSAELLWQLEQRSESEINALVSILRGSLNL